MNQQREPAPEDGIIEKILSDGEAQARRLIENARRSEASEERKAAAEADRIRSEILAKAQAKAKTIRSKLIATGHIEAKRVLLKAREQAIQKVFDMIEQELAKVRKNQKEYAAALVSLAVEAISGVAEPAVTLKVAREDEALADDEFITQVRERLSEIMGQETKITVEIDPRLRWGGCVAVGAQGRVVFDNTFGRRLERMRSALRSAIAREVLKTDG